VNIVPASNFRNARLGRKALLDDPLPIAAVAPDQTEPQPSSSRLPINVSVNEQTWPTRHLIRKAALSEA
jgi:hypothetical protein